MSDANYESAKAVSAEASASTTDSISLAASTQVKGKEFVKTATVNMEVKDVYDTTIKIENQLKQMGGYVINSELKNNLLSEETYNQSDDKAVMVKNQLCRMIWL